MIEEHTPEEDRLVVVCDHCFQASCWNGEFMCDEAQCAGIVSLPISKLREMALEHPDNWREEE